jgi:hypothetical protein
VHIIWISIVIEEKLLRFTNILLVFIVGVVVIGSPISAFGCRVLAPDFTHPIEPPCEDSIVLDMSMPGVANFLDYTPVLISVVTLGYIFWNNAERRLPIPSGCHCSPLLPPPRI